MYEVRCQALSYSGGYIVNAQFTVIIDTLKNKFILRPRELLLTLPKWD